MGSINSTSNNFQALSENIFTSQVQQSGQLEYYAGQALQRGLENYRQERYDQALKDFQRARNIAPRSNYATSAAEYMAGIHIKEGDKEKAVKAYQDTIKLNPGDTRLRDKLGLLLFDMQRYKEAEETYRASVRIDKNAANTFSLGQALIKTKRFTEAEQMFREVKRMAPQSVNGDYGLGMVYKEKGLPELALKHFEATTKIKRNFYDGYAEMGYVHADLGQTEEAEEILARLEKKAPMLADLLSRYMYKVSQPEFAYVWPTSTFPKSMVAGSKLSFVDSYLQTANAAKQFTMVFQFSKEMDESSVENRFNWVIKRSDKSGAGQFYNYTNPLPDTEVKIAAIPDSVVYDPKLLTATVTFTLKQNAAANGTIDPSHILFSFRGEDLDGNKMSADGDEYSSATGIV